MELLELNDIQGYVIRGYGDMRFSRFVLLKITDASLAKIWLKNIWPSLTSATPIGNIKQRPETNLNIAFTADGMLRIGLSEKNLNTFSHAFREGMITPHRQRMLGDIGSSAPEKWTWGGMNNERTHINLMIFGLTEEICLEYYARLSKDFAENGLTELNQLDGHTLPENKEHFGFRDGISQPIVRGSGQTGPENNTVNPGEFILGYPNEYNVFPDSPSIEDIQGDWNLLSPNNDNSGNKDLGRNGTYLVIRHLKQDVDAFWTFMNEQTKNEDQSINEEESIKLASKMVGRWPEGAPVTKYPDKNPGVISNENDFGYAKEDPDGLKCPFGSHLRRNNPRDSFEDNRTKMSYTLSNRHRIIRRGRMYGEVHVGTPNNRKPNGEVGIFFNCFNSDITRQFEFLQYAWINYTKNKLLYDDPDPILGVNDVSLLEPEKNFTIQAEPVNCTIKGLPQFVTVKGGSYFFFPSITVIRYLSTL